MIFQKSLEIPANTSADTPESVTFPIAEGTVNRVWIRWRWGSANLCGARVLYNAFQYWPMSIGEWFPSTVYPLEFAESFQLAAEPYVLTLEGYNDDDTFSHTVWVAFNIIRPRIPESLRQFFTDVGVIESYG